MYFEFEMSTSNSSDSKPNNSVDENGGISNNNNNNNNDSFQSPSSISQFGFSSPSSSSSSSQLSLSPLANNQSSTPLKSTIGTLPLPPPPSSLPAPSTLPRHRRYSIHSSQSLFTLDSLPDNSNVTFCDLALITKKKLLQLNGSCYIRSLTSDNSSLQSPNSSTMILSPDIKLSSQPFNKHNNNDLRREVLLASIQRSLSASSEDLFSLSSANSSRNDLTLDNLQHHHQDDSGTNEESSMDVVVQSANISPSNQPKSLEVNIDSMIINPHHHMSHNPLMINSISNLSDDLMNDFSSYQMEMRRLQFPSYRIKARRSQSASYTPSGNNNNMSALTTFTSTTSMAGCKNICALNNKNNNNGSPNSKNNILNSLNFGLMGSSSAITTYSNSPKLASLTMSSSPFSSSPLKKRLHSTSPSKYSPSPYHTISNSICKDFNLIFSSNSNPASPNQSQQLLSSADWDIAFKRLKVMHCEGGGGGAGAGAAAAATLDQSPNSSTTTGSSSTSNQSISNDGILDGSSGDLQQNATSTASYHLHHPQQFNPNVGESTDLNDLAQDFHRLKTPFI